MDTRTVRMGFAVCTALGALTILRAEERKGIPDPLWDGKESVAEYAKRTGLEPARTLDLGGGVKLELVLIPAGKFTMGSPDADMDRSSNEGPRHEVTISQPFYMGKFTVTVGQFAQFVKATQYQTDAEKEGAGIAWTGKALETVKGANWQKPGFDQTDRHPVTLVSWADAQKFCEWLAQRAGRAVRLPTEAEWEYACRAGSGTRFSFGDDEGPLHQYGNYCEATCTADFTWRDKRHSDRFDKTAPVGSFKPNAWGLFDMHGNVWQWCRDWYAEAYAAAPAADPQGPAHGTARVLRGGSWCYGARVCRSTYRTRDAPEYQLYISRGFRVTAGLK